VAAAGGQLVDDIGCSGWLPPPFQERGQLVLFFAHFCVGCPFHFVLQIVSVIFTMTMLMLGSE
jgi:hypothetical protein